MRCLFITAAAFIAVVYYTGAHTEGIAKSMQSILYAYTGRNQDGEFVASTSMTYSIEEVEPDDPEVYYVPEIPKEAEQDTRYYS